MSTSEGAARRSTDVRWRQSVAWLHGRKGRIGNVRGPLRQRGSVRCSGTFGNRGTGGTGPGSQPSYLLSSSCVYSFFEHLQNLAALIDR